MKCLRCGADFDDSFKFCPNCTEPNPITASQQVSKPTTKVKEGDKCVARSDIIIGVGVDGKTAFYKGNYIIVDKVVSSPSGSVNKYKVQSNLLDQTVSLDSEDVVKYEESEWYETGKGGKKLSIQEKKQKEKKNMTMANAWFWIIWGTIVMVSVIVFPIAIQSNVAYIIDIFLAFFGGYALYRGLKLLFFLKKHEALQEDERKCPFCAEPVKREAIRCKHCGADMATQQSAQQTTGQPAIQPPQQAIAQPPVMNTTNGTNKGGIARYAGCQCT